MLALGLLLGPATAAPVTHATPSLWHVHGPAGDAWLLGSVHILTPDLDWHTPAIADAMKRATVFVFEVSEDAPSMTRMRQLVAAHGYLAEGQSLRAMLPPPAQAKYDAALAAAHLPLDTVDHEQPWLAGLQLMLGQMAQHDYAADSGVDVTLMAYARTAHKRMRYLETVEQQFALLASDDQATALAEFESGLDDLGQSDTDLQPMVEAWAAGDQALLAKLVDADTQDFPAARKALFDDRNRAWVGKITTMLRERRTYFITVGAGHLAGPGGVPDLLRKAGYKVDGP